LQQLAATCGGDSVVIMECPGQITQLLYPKGLSVIRNGGKIKAQSSTQRTGNLRHPDFQHDLMDARHLHQIDDFLGGIGFRH